VHHFRALHQVALVSVPPHKFVVRVLSIVIFQRAEIKKQEIEVV
jgi:hypothetical protein